MDTFTVNLTEKAEFADSGIVSKTILDEPYSKVVLFTFSRGQCLSEHTASMPAVIHFLSGRAKTLLGETWNDCGPGSWCFMPAGLNHAITAEEDTVMLLTLYKKGV